MSLSPRSSCSIETWRRIVIAWGDTRLASGRGADLVRLEPRAVRAGQHRRADRCDGASCRDDGASRRRPQPAHRVINVAVNIATGFVVALIAGYDALRHDLSYGHATLGVVVAVVMLVGMLALPFILPQHARAGRARLTGRRLVTRTSARSRAIYLALVGNLVAWIAVRAELSAARRRRDRQSRPGSVAHVHRGVRGGLRVRLSCLLRCRPGSAFAKSFRSTALDRRSDLATGPQAAVIVDLARLLTHVLEIVRASSFSRAALAPDIRN